MGETNVYNVTEYMVKTSFEIDFFPQTLSSLNETKIVYLSKYHLCFIQDCKRNTV